MSSSCLVVLFDIILKKDNPTDMSLRTFLLAPKAGREGMIRTYHHHKQKKIVCSRWVENSVLVWAYENHKS